ncbi:MAG: M28 family peptidase [Flavobacteriaceae bacterium]
MNFKYILPLFICILISNHCISQDSNQEIKSTLLKDLIKTPKKLSKEEIKKKSTRKLKESSKEYGKSITKEELKELLYVFSSDEFGGRGTPSKGQDLATDFLKENYIDLGIQPARKNTYKHKVFLQFDEKPNISLSINKKEFKYYTDYIAYNNGPDTSFSDTEIIYVGYGIDHKNYNSYDGLDVKDKVVLAIAGEPKNRRGNYFINGGKKKSEWSTRNEISRKKEAAAKNGAKALILINNRLFKRYSNEQILSDTNKGEKRMSLASDKISENTQVLLFSDKNKDYLLQKNRKFMNFSFEKNYNEFSANNIAALIKGSEFPDEYIVITAHLDHVGIQNGVVYNGADDDGSGSVGILEIAEAFSLALKEGFRPKRSILFLHVTAEENGLLGSEYYTDYDPIIPLSETMVCLNMDMIGRTESKRKETEPKDYIYIIGSEMLSDDLHNINKKANEENVKLNLDYRYNDPTSLVFESGRYIENQYYYRSDHYNFAKYNIPSIFFFSGVHEDYHMPTDTADKILYDIYEKRIKLIFHTAWDLANADKKIELNK